MGQVQFIPSQNTWANMGTQVGQQIGNAFNTQMQQDAINKATQKALSVALGQYDQAMNPNYNTQQLTDAATKYTGIQGLNGMNAVQGIANAQKNWQDANTQLAGINDQLANTSDPMAQKTLTDQKTSLIGKMDLAHKQADFLRGVLTSKGTDLTGLGPNNDASAYLKNSNNFYSGLIPQGALTASNTAIQGITNAKTDYANAQQKLNDIKNQIANAEDTTDVQSLQDQATTLMKQISADHANADWNRSALFGSNSLLGPKGQAVLDADGKYSNPYSASAAMNGNQTTDALNKAMLTNAISNAATKESNSYTLNADDIAKDQNIANLAKQSAYAAARTNWDPTAYSTGVMQALLKDGVDPNTIAKLQPLIDKQANDIGARYFSDYLQNSNGDTKNAALYAISHGMSGLIPTAQVFANKNQIDKTDTGKNINYFDIGTSAFGGQPTFSAGPSLAKTTTPEADLNATLTREKLKEQGQEFAASLAQKDRQFNMNYQLAQTKLAVGTNLQNKQIATQRLAQIKGVSDNIRAGIAGLQDQANTIIKANAGMTLSSEDQAKIASINSQISAATQQYNALNNTLANEFGIALPSSDPIDQKIDQARINHSSEEIKAYLDANGLGAYKSHVW
jgi:hypothetical protein